MAFPAVAQANPAPEGQGTSVQELLRELSERDDVQTALPGDPTGRDARQRTAPPPPGKARKPRSAEPERRSSLRERESGSSGLGEVLAWGLVFAVAVMLVVALVNGFADRRRRETTRKDKKGAPAAPPATPAPPPLRDFEQLAAEGRYAEAVHALLLHAFVRLAERRATGWPAAKTGREILAAVGGFAAADKPLRLVFQTSEAAWFGKVDIDRNQYEECLANFRNWSTS
jgi:hypothetical protein